LNEYKIYIRKLISQIFKERGTLVKISGLLKGARTKKFLHLGHLLIEFLRKVLKAVGKTTKHDVEKIDHTIRGGSKSKAATKGLKSSKSVSTKSTGVASKGTGSLGSSGLTGSAATGAAGASVSATTLAAIVVVSSVAVGGMGANCFITNQSPIAILQESIKSPAEILFPTVSISNDLENSLSSTQDPFTKSFQPEIKEAVQTVQNDLPQTTNTPNPTQTQKSPTYQPSSGSGSSNPNTPYQEQKIDYQVPENP
jgi:hypothetical protein